MDGWRALGLLLVGLLVVSCKDVSPHPPVASSATRVVVERVDGETFLLRGDERRRLGKLDAERVVRLTDLMFPHANAGRMDGGAVVDFESAKAAQVYVEATLWVDALIAARRTLSLDLGPNPQTGSALAAETFRRYLLVDPPVDPPDWGALTRALEDGVFWEEKASTAGMAAVFLACVLAEGGGGEWSRRKAGELFSRVISEPEMPPWLSVLAYENWSRRDFLAKDERP